MPAGLWIVLSSLRPTVEIMAKPPVWIPQEITLDAYRAMFGGAGQGGIPIWDYFRNSLIVFDHLHRHRARHRHVRRLRFRAL